MKISSLRVLPPKTPTGNAGNDNGGGNHCYHWHRRVVTPKTQALSRLLPLLPLLPHRKRMPRKFRDDRAKDMSNQLVNPHIPHVALGRVFERVNRRGELATRSC
jgi:hypothetical protein